VERKGFLLANRGLGYQLATGILIIVVIPALIIGSLLLVQHQRTLKQNAGNTLSLLGQLKVEEVVRTRQELREAMGQLIAVPSNYEVYQQALLSRGENDVNLQQVQQNFDQTMNGFISIRHMRLFSTTAAGTLIERGTELPLSSSRSQQIVQVASTTVTAIYAGFDDVPLIDVIVPITDNGEVRTIGYVIVTQNLEMAGNDPLPNIFEPIQEPPQIENFPSTYVGLFDAAGRVLVSSQGDQAFSLDFAEHPSIETLRTGEGLSTRQIETGKVSEYDSPIFDENVRGYFIEIDELAWILIIEVPEVDVLQPLLSRTVPILVIGFGGIILLALVWNAGIYRSMDIPLRRLTQAMSVFSPIESNQTLVPIERLDGVGKLHNTFVGLADQINEAVKKLQSDNDIYARDISIIDETGRLVQDVQDISYLLEQFVRMLCEHIPVIDYGQVFLLEADVVDSAILVAGIGETGRRLLSQGYRQSLTQTSHLGQVVITGKPIIIEDLDKHPQKRQLDLMVETRTEAIIPMRIGASVIGIIDLHSRQHGVFVSHDLTILSTVGTIVANAIEYYHLSSELVTGMYRRGSATDVRDTTVQRSVDSVSAQVGKVSMQKHSSWTKLQEEAVKARKAVVHREEDIVSFALPIILRGEVLGAVEWSIEAHRFSQNMLQTAQDLVDRLSIATDNAQLFEQSRRLVERERLINEITRKLSTQTDVRQILQVAVRELGQALGTTETNITLDIGKQTTN
jgi:GAF domain-containing protein